MALTGRKPAVQSIGIWGAVVAAGAGAAQLIGYTISPTDQAALVNLIESGVVAVTSIVTIAGAALSIWGRMTATKQIKGVVKSR